VAYFQKISFNLANSPSKFTKEKKKCIKDCWVNP
jgi:hypothetical protein